MKYEEALKKIEEIVKKLEAGNLELEESMKLYEEGVHFTKLCEDQLKNAEKKIEVLVSIEQDQVKTKKYEIE